MANISFSREARMGPSLAPRGPKKTVIIRDDEPNLVRAYRNILERRCGQLYSFAFIDTKLETKSDILRLLRGNQSIDLVISDMRYPVLGGIEFATIVREVAPKVKILISSAYGDRKKVLPFLEAKTIDTFLSKPVTGTILASSVIDLLEGRIPDSVFY